ncbi:SDR family oxidoreductase [Silvibacterium sp.]|uniref:SDR family oxidoreductase n=1 Tax=Silvibacterium sp. TaxID=1964179 RepID=UPI0039E60D94
MAVWLVTGASSGFGLYLTQELLAQGHSVAALSRHPHKSAESSNSLLQIAADITNEDQVSAAVRETIDRFGRIDVVVNNAGRGLLGAVEEANEQEIRTVFDVNLFGALNIIRHTLPFFREQRSGTYVAISSLSGVSGGAGWGVYSASKFALEGASEALAKESGPLGIQVLIVEPGVFRTSFLNADNLLVSGKEIAAYEGVSEQRRRLEGNNSRQPGNPQAAATRIIERVSEPFQENVANRLILGSDALRVIQTKVDLLTAQLEANRSGAAATDYAEGA